MSLISTSRPIHQPAVDKPLPDRGDTFPFIEITSKKQPSWKRWLDLLGGTLLLAMVFPLLMVISIYIKCVSPGPVLFVQERIGAGGQRFKMFKFRTMHVAHQGDTHRTYIASLIHSDAPAQKPEYNSRLIRGGATLRSLSLDELPQLFNVLLGNMSLIGPRPEVLQIEDYEAWQLRRFEVLPGISGLWQVSGKNRLTFNQMIRLDIQYVDELTFALDMKIAFKTLGVILHRSNH